MKKATNYLKDLEEIWDELSEDEQRTAREKAIGMLKRLSLKRCDLGRIPRSLGKLSKSGRTAISPFVAYTIIRQLHIFQTLHNIVQKDLNSVFPAMKWE